MGEQIFISYASADVEYAQAMREGLLREGYAIWMAPGSIPSGSDYSTQIMNGILGSAIVVLLLSRASNKSDFVRKEIERAATHKLRIIPLRIEGTLPAGGLQYLISELQWVDGLESDPAFGVQRVVDALKGGEAKRVSPLERGAIRFNAPTIAFVIAGIAGAVAIFAGLWRPTLNNIAAAILFGVAITAGGAGFLLQMRGWKPGQIMTLRLGDVVISALVLTGAAVSVAGFLFTPALVAIVLLVIYLVARNSLSLRGRWLALATCAALGATVAFGEGLFYSALGRTTQTLLVVPDQCASCNQVDFSIYREIVLTLNRHLNEPARVYPNANCGEDVQQRTFGEMSQVYADPARRAPLLAHYIATCQDVFDDLVRVQLWRAQACGAPSAALQYELGAWLPGRSPFWSRWQWGPLHALAGDDAPDLRARIRFDANGAASKEDVKLSATLLSAGLLRRLIETSRGERAYVEAAKRLLGDESPAPSSPEAAALAGAIVKARSARSTRQDVVQALTLFILHRQAELLPPSKDDCETASRQEAAIFDARFDTDVGALMENGE